TGALAPEQLRATLNLQSEAVDRLSAAPKRSPIETGRLEEDIDVWLDEHAVANPFDLASTLVADGLDRPWLEMAADAIGADELSGALNWIGDTLLATALLDQIEDATARISQMVSVVKDYSYVDRSVDQEIDIQDGIEKTLVILRH